ncbi:hypothetical protein MKZ38_004025 [Zalerion maritima]|uniref:tRNA (guanine(26)-N(2))-dimethyltransferase n=1 Tax=Zalerion maritima TaxID=339359 RepID=A0AAD5WRB5_9PEZI|nr:hypothetical protein MKZ38_004025 [Zalerion maritima]
MRQAFAIGWLPQLFKHAKTTHRQFCISLYLRTATIASSSRTMAPSNTTPADTLNPAPAAGDSETRKTIPQAKNTSRILWKDKPYIGVQEGLATILIPEADHEAEAKKHKKTKTKNEDGSEVQQVFYNPIQQFNRDLTILAIKAYAEEVIEKKKRAAENGRRGKNNKRRNRNGVDGSAETGADAESRPNKVSKTGKDGDVTSPAGDPMDIVNESSENLEDSSKATAAAAAAENATTSGHEEAAVEAATAEEANGKTEPKPLPPPKFTILDALSASGLRALRYAHEIPLVTSVTANDLMASAVDSIKQNAEYNGLSSKIRANQADARGHMYQTIASSLEQLGRCNAAAANNKRYDVVDLDPYGTAAPFFDCAVQSVRDDGGLLCVTCTDSAIFAGTGYPEKTYALYGGVPMKGYHSHEVGLRLVLNGIATTAARYGLAIEPLLSLSVDYYLRIFVRVRKSPAAVKFLSAKTMVVYNCDHGCGSWSTQLLAKNKVAPNKKGTGTFYKHGFAIAPQTDQLCEHCGSKMHLGGPMYAGPLHSNEFVQRILDALPEADTRIYGTTARIEGMLRTALEEYLPQLPHPNTAGEEGGEMEKLDPPPEKDLAAVEPYPLYFLLTALSRVLHCQTPHEDGFRGALIGLGYRVTRSHCKPGSLKTDAPWTVVWHVMREFVRQKAPVKTEGIRVGSAAWKLLRLGEEEKGGDGKGLAERNGEGGKEKTAEVVFDEKLGRESRKSAADRNRKIVRYQVNPTRNWGPMNKATGP